MKKLMQIIEATWKELIIAAVMVVMGHELIQVRLELDRLQEQTGLRGASSSTSPSGSRSSQPDTRAFKSDLRSVTMRLASLESDVRSIKSRVSSVESELRALDRKARY